MSASRQGTRLRATSDVERLLYRAGLVFRPSAPIDSRELFAGRVEEIRKAIDAISSVGQHAIIYGERGVGKTSLANILKPMLETFGDSHSVVKINCTTEDTFSSIWHKALDRLTAPGTQLQIGFNSTPSLQSTPLKDLLPKIHVVPDDIINLLAEYVNLVFIFDEFDRLSNDATHGLTDLIKMMSDNIISATLIIVGVADTVDRLISDHRSIDRALVQILMPRMDESEMREILSRAAKDLDIKFADGADHKIVQMAQGLPHYVHLLGLFSVKDAIVNGSLEVNQANVEVGIREAVEKTAHSVKSEYHQATYSVRKDALFQHVLLACALAEKDVLSFFPASNVRAPLAAIANRPIDIPQFARHLTDFCSRDRGSPIERFGKERNYKYRFRNPLLEPYLIMRGISSGLITTDQVEKIRADARPS